ncbi:O-antigen ligase family protein [Mariniflexile sp.]|uniref:O-antigen ligase family protein n=1 Tax=Mariniflexile sp. TaxID=1979402 RepID=UPI0035676B11
MKDAIRNFFLDIKEKYYLDACSFFLYLSVSFCFPKSYKYLMPVIIGLTIIQLIRLKRRHVTSDYIKKNYFHLLIFSLLFFRSVHTALLIINLVLHIYFFFHNREKINNKNLSFEIYVLVLFALIVINFLITASQVKELDTFLYLLIYPLLFIVMKQQYFVISISKVINVYLTSVLICVFYLFIINALNNTITTSTNTYFPIYLDITHVYLGMYIGLGLCFLLALKIRNKTYIRQKLDYLIFAILLFMLIYIGARIALIAVLLLILLSFYIKIQLKPFIKIIILSVILFGILAISFKAIPRVRMGVDSIVRIYESIRTDNKFDMVHNSWENMNQRYLIISYSVKEIEKNYLFGIGIKNVKELVSNKIIADGFIHFSPINTHNQYLHYMLGMGIPSFLFFAWMLISFLKANRNIILALYYMIFFLVIMMTESILVRISGLSLFFLFYLIFSFNVPIKQDC